MKIIITGNPKQIPSRCGRLRTVPKFGPEAIIMILFGPGVIAAVNANKKMGRTSSISAYQSLEPVW